jgi:hypothetical protein
MIVRACAPRRKSGGKAQLGSRTRRVYRPAASEPQLPRQASTGGCPRLRGGAKSAMNGELSSDATPLVKGPRVGGLSSPGTGPDPGGHYVYKAKIFANRGRTRSHKATLARDAKRRLRVTTRLEEPTAARTDHSPESTELRRAGSSTKVSTIPLKRKKPYTTLKTRPGQMCPNVSNRIRLRNTRGSGHKRGTGRDKAIPGRTIASVLNTHTHTRWRR